MHQYDKILIYIDYFSTVGEKVWEISRRTMVGGEHTEICTNKVLIRLHELISHEANELYNEIEQQKESYQ